MADSDSIPIDEPGSSPDQSTQERHPDSPIPSMEWEPTPAPEEVPVPIPSIEIETLPSDPRAQGMDDEATPVPPSDMDLEKTPIPTSLGPELDTAGDILDSMDELKAAPSTTPILEPPAEATLGHTSTETQQHGPSAPYPEPAPTAHTPADLAPETGTVSSFTDVDMPSADLSPDSMDVLEDMLATATTNPPQTETPDGPPEPEEPKLVPYGPGVTSIDNDQPVRAKLSDMEEYMFFANLYKRQFRLIARTDWHEPGKTWPLTVRHDAPVTDAFRNKPYKYGDFSKSAKAYAWENTESTVFLPGGLKILGLLKEMAEEVSKLPYNGQKCHYIVPLYITTTWNVPPEMRVDTGMEWIPPTNIDEIVFVMADLEGVHFSESTCRYWSRFAQTIHKVLVKYNLGEHAVQVGSF